ncbi:hypothetical protein PIB30_009217 [Stylosanthes scabra]|uniref:BZIP domain-containing protein n=1 Tax=Stylosanthes scabra TaxID=79078 RepID=A0ABU6Q602_9FABA|nr:hypothetical protein [Stylosanthes scabra]
MPRSSWKYGGSGIETSSDQTAGENRTSLRRDEGQSRKCKRNRETEEARRKQAHGNTLVMFGSSHRLGQNVTSMEAHVTPKQAPHHLKLKDTTFGPSSKHGVNVISSPTSKVKQHQT